MADTERGVIAGFGWTPARERAFADERQAGLVPGRVTSSGGTTIASTESGPLEIVIQRRFKRALVERTGMPAVGDWLALAPQASSVGQAALRAVLPRSGTFIRHRLSDGRPQVLAANVDIAFLVSGLDHDLNLRRIERYLVLALDGGVSPIVVLNKSDVAEDLAAARAAVDASFRDIEDLARACRFDDCAHETEPGCAVRWAVDADTLSPARLASYRKLDAERRSAEIRSDVRERREADRHLGRIYRRAGKDSIRFKRGG